MRRKHGASKPQFKRAICADAGAARHLQRKAHIMVGIALSPEQIRAAPPMVRDWLEHEIRTSLGLHTGTSIEGPSHLVACTPPEAAAIFSAIRSMLPVVNVFFELGRQGESINQQGLEAFRLEDMARHTRLFNVQELNSCLELIDRAFRQIRNDVTVTLYAVDPRGYCVVAEATQRNIMAVWNSMVAAQNYGMSTGSTNTSRSFGHLPPIVSLENDAGLKASAVTAGPSEGPRPTVVQPDAQAEPDVSSS